MHRFPPRFLSTLAVGLLLATAVVPRALAQGDDRPLFEDRTDFEMVLVHGLGGSTEIWKDTLPVMEKTFRIYNFELSGHGRTAPVENPGIDTEVRRLEAFIQENGIRYPTLVGHGLGGMIALQYTLDHQRAVHRLIVIDAAPKQLIDDIQKQTIITRLADDYDRFVAERYLNMTPDQAITDRILDMALRTDSASFIGLLLSSFDYDVSDRLRTLSVPLLIIGSELMFPSAESARPVLERIGWGQARSLSFKRIGLTGHYVMMEQPVYVASVLMAFGVTAGYRFED